MTDLTKIVMVSMANGFDIDIDTAVLVIMLSLHSLCPANSTLRRLLPDSCA